MLVRPNSDGTYSATWTPGSVGWNSVLVTIDGYDMEEVSKDKLFIVELKAGIANVTYKV
jgi:E3 ubiquitin-protein ligase MYCBP2